MKRPPWKVADGKGTVLALSKVDTSLCLQRLTEEVGVKGSPTSLAFTTLNTEGTQRLGEELSLTVKALTSNDYIHLDRVWTVNNLQVSKKSIPCTEDIHDWPHLKGISLPKLDKEVSILIGNDVPIESLKSAVVAVNGLGGCSHLTSRLFTVRLSSSCH